MLKLQKNELHQVDRYISDKLFYRKLLADKFGRRYLAYRKNWEKAVCGKLITDFPLHIDLDTVDRCNLRCNRCQEENSRIRTYKQISPELVKKIFREAEKENLCSINVGAIGEPLLEKNILKSILELANKIGVMETYVHTNGLLLDSQASSKLIEADLTFLCVSVDAADSKTYKKIRGGDFNLLKNNIDEFIAIRTMKKRVFPLLRISCLELNENPRARREFMDTWGKLADIIDYQPLINYDRRYKKPFNVTARCYSPFSRLMVGTCGQLGACCCGIAFNKDMLLGNLNKQTISQAWNGNKIAKLREALLKIELKDFPTCYDCLQRRKI